MRRVGARRSFLFGNGGGGGPQGPFLINVGPTADLGLKKVSKQPNITYNVDTVVSSSRIAPITANVLTINACALTSANKSIFIWCDTLNINTSDPVIAHIDVSGQDGGDGFEDAGIQHGGQGGAGGSGGGGGCATQNAMTVNNNFISDGVAGHNGATDAAPAVVGSGGSGSGTGYIDGGFTYPIGGTAYDRDNAISVAPSGPWGRGATGGGTSGAGPEYGAGGGGGAGLISIVARRIFSNTNSFDGNLVTSTFLTNGGSAGTGFELLPLNQAGGGGGGVVVIYTERFGVADFNYSSGGGVGGF